MLQNKLAASLDIEKELLSQIHQLQKQVYFTLISILLQTPLLYINTVQVVRQLLQEQTLQQQLMEARNTPEPTTSDLKQGDDTSKEEGSESPPEGTKPAGSFKDEAHLLALQNKIYHLSVSLDEANATIKGISLFNNSTQFGE